MRWRTALINWPARITEVASVWYRLYLIALLWMAAIIPLGTVIIALTLWFGFGVRWGW